LFIGGNNTFIFILIATMDEAWIRLNLKYVFVVFMSNFTTYWGWFLSPTFPWRDVELILVFDAVVPPQCSVRGRRAPRGTSSWRAPSTWSSTERWVIPFLRFQIQIQIKRCCRCAEYSTTYCAEYSTKYSDNEMYLNIWRSK
jgi:hypothetical protein